MATKRRSASAAASARPSSIATIRDVAARAGVSVATVSRTLNGVGPVHDATSRRVLAAARSLRYVPHAAARSLSSRRTHTLGVVLPEVHGEFFSEVIRGVDVAARSRGYHILVSSSHDDATEMSNVLHTLRGRVDGLIVMSPDTALGALARALPPATPAVLLNTATNARPTIRIDNFSGARAMTEYLVSLGHRRIAFISGPEHNSDAVERRRAYRSALGDDPQKMGSSLEIEGDFTEESGFQAAGKIMAMKPRPTAIFAANDAMAIGALQALRQAGIRVPEDVALAGFDDIPMARYVTPQLTTVHVDISEMGRRAVEYLFASLDRRDEAEPRHDIVPTTLVVRESCRAPQAPGPAPTLKVRRSAGKEESR